MTHCCVGLNILLVISYGIDSFSRSKLKQINGLEIVSEIPALLNRLP